MAKNRLAVALSLPIGAALLLQVNPAKALTITVGTTDYDVQLFTGSVSQLLSSSLLTPPPSVNFPWFGDTSLATDFVNAYTTADGTTQQLLSDSGLDVTMGPLFYTFAGTGGSGDIFYTYNFDTTGVSSFVCDSLTGVDCSATTIQWAYVQPPAPAAPVPTPLPLMGAAAAFSFSRKLRRRLSVQKFSF